jgi:D-lactate dehydrogenase (cytochrome)
MTVLLIFRLLTNISINSEDMNVKVGSGITKNELNKLLGVHGLLFGPDPSSNPSLGKFQH